MHYKAWAVFAWRLSAYTLVAIGLGIACLGALIGWGPKEAARLWVDAHRGGI